MTAASAGAAQARTTCWQAVIDEWAAGHLRTDHSVSCYREAIAKAPSDLKLYSTFGDQVRRAIQSRVLSQGGRGVTRRLSSASAPRPARADTGRSTETYALAAGALALAVVTAASGVLVALRRRRAGPAV